MGQRGGQRLILGAVAARERFDLGEVVLRLFAVALFDLPQAVILPGADVVRIRLQCALIPDAGKLVVAELADTSIRSGWRHRRGRPDRAP